MNQQSPSSLVDFPRSVWLLIGAWVVLVAGAVLWAVPHQERHLADQSIRALAGTRLSASFEGRDALLAGVAITDVEVDRAVVDLLGIRGVRTVDIGEVDVAEDGSVVPVSTLSITVDAGRLAITGFIPDPATEDAVVAAATAVFGEGNVAADLDVEPRVIGAAWLGAVPSVMEAMPDLRAGTVLLGADGFIVDGEVASVAVGDSLIAALREVAGGLPVDDRLRVATGGQPTFMAELSNGVLDVAGELPNSDLIDGIEGTAALFYGADSVTSALRMGPVADAPHLQELPGLLDALRGIAEWSVELVGDRLVVSGTGSSESVLDATATEIDELFAGAVDVEVSFDLDEVSVATALTELLAGSTNFAAGSAELPAEAVPRLDEAIAILEANPSTRMSVQGHTDSEGSEASNLALSQARAESVVAYLVAGGIDPARLNAVGFGESMPIDTNDTAAGRAANRRIEFVVIEGDT